MTREELIAALEKATGADRELDLEIFRHCANGEWRWQNRERETITWDEYGPNAPGNPVYGLERYTASIDAALALYVNRPARVPSDPRLACIEALQQQAAALKAQGGGA